MLKLICRLKGGLGNQLFMYAACRRLALKNNAELVIDDKSGFLYDSQFNRNYQLNHFNIQCKKVDYFELLKPFSRIRRYLKRRWNKFLSFEKRNYIMQEGINFDSRLLNFKFNKKVYIEGYWQSEKYFKDVEKQIRLDLKIKRPKDKKNQNMAHKIKNNLSVAVHLRFFDNPRLNDKRKKNINNVSKTYYEHAFKKMEKVIPNAHYFVFTDIPKYVKNIISLKNKKITIVEHNNTNEMAYADLWLMSQCQHFIIANSTFSWWGAWLSLNKNKIVIAPKIKILNNRVNSNTSWGFSGLIPNNWQKI